MRFYASRRSAHIVKREVSNGSVNRNALARWSAASIRTADAKCTSMLARWRISDERRVYLAPSSPTRSRTLMEPRNFLTARNSVANFRPECHEASRPDEGRESLRVNLDRPKPPHNHPALLRSPVSPRSLARSKVIPRN